MNLSKGITAGELLEISRHHRDDTGLNSCCSFVQNNAIETTASSLDLAKKEDGKYYSRENKESDRDSNTIMGSEDIYPKYLTHGGNFRLISRVIRTNEELLFLYDVPEKPFWLDDHFPNDPIMPGVLLSESGNQAAALFIMLNNDEYEKGKQVILTGVEAQFKRPVRPKDEIVMKIAKVYQEDKRNNTEFSITVEAYFKKNNKLCFKQVTRGISRG